MAVCKDILTKNPDGTWNLLTEDKLTYTYDSNGSTYIQNEYDEWGRVVRQTDEEGLETCILAGAIKLEGK